LNDFSLTPESAQPSAEPEASAERRTSLIEALHRVAAGDRAALSEVYSATSAKLFAVCLRILPDRDEAEDALQEAYLTVWRNAGRFDAARASPITWLVTLTRNRALDRLRGRKRLRLEPLELGRQVADPAVGADLLSSAPHSCRDRPIRNLPRAPRFRSAPSRAASGAPCSSCGSASPNDHP
jgi:RNA polymerase sigma-70 factor (ECF subfamily)